MLTPRQQQLLALICETVEDAGTAPTHREIMARLGLKSTGHMNAMLRTLQSRGYMRRVPHRARALEPLRNPDGTPFSAPGSAYDDLLTAVHAVLNEGAPVESLRAPYERCVQTLPMDATAGFPDPARGRGPSPGPAPATLPATART